MVPLPSAPLAPAFVGLLALNLFSSRPIASNVDWSIVTGLAELALAPAFALTALGFLRSLRARTGAGPSSVAATLAEGEGREAIVVVRLELGVLLIGRAEVDAIGLDGSDSWARIESVFQ